VRRLVVVATAAVAAIVIALHWWLGNGEHPLLLAVYLATYRGGESFIERV